MHFLCSKGCEIFILMLLCLSPSVSWGAMAWQQSSRCCFITFKCTHSPEGARFLPCMVRVCVCIPVLHFSLCNSFYFNYSRSLNLSLKFNCHHGNTEPPQQSPTHTHPKKKEVHMHVDVYSHTHLKQLFLQLGEEDYIVIPERMRISVQPDHYC